jgi:hypothetical protein
VILQTLQESGRHQRLRRLRTLAGGALKKIQVSWIMQQAAFVASADTVETIEKIKPFTGDMDSKPLLVTAVGDVTKAATESVLGVPLVAVGRRG